MDEYKEMLDQLRESGQINMFEASRLLMEFFGLSKSEARQIVSDWMKASA